MSRLTEIEERWRSEFLPDQQDAEADIEYLLGEVRRLREFHEAHDAVEFAIADFDLHGEAVERLRAAHAALHPDPGEEAR